MSDVLELADTAELVEAFSPTAGFLAKYMTAVTLRQRWRCCRKTVKRIENRGLLPCARRVFGQNWYSVAAVQRAERTLFGEPA